MEIGLRKQNFFQRKDFFDKFYFNKRCKNEIEYNNEKIFSRFSESVSNKIDFMAYGYHRDQPPAWELIIERGDFLSNLCVRRNSAQKELGEFSGVFEYLKRRHNFTNWA